MNRPLRHTRMLLPSLAAASLMLAGGCGSKLEGTYENANGAMSIEFKSGKAYLSMLGQTVEAEYKVDGNKIILAYEGDTTAFIRNDDGTLSTPGLVGTLTKKR